MATFANPRALLDAVGSDLGVTPWTTITQEQIDGFADATHDHQWIHVDPERAARGPFGTTIAHGYLTLALANHFLAQLVTVSDLAMGLNYGVDRVRFPAPVPVDSRLRGHGVVREVTEVAGGVQAVVRVTVQLERGERPAAVVDTVSRYLGAAAEQDA